MLTTSLKVLGGIMALLLIGTQLGASLPPLPLPTSWTTLGFTQTATDRAHRPLAFALDGALIASYDIGRVKTQVSSDHMQTWVTIASPTLQFPIRTLAVTQTGAWLANAGSSLYRSADAGTTWRRVLDFTGGRPGYANNIGILNNGWTQSPDGTVYVAVYTTAVGGYAGGQAPVYRSGDDGQTWTVHSTFPTSIGHANPPGPTTIRHLHGIAALPSGLWLLTGDTGLEAGLWRWEQDQWVRQSPPDPDFSHSQRWRAVSVQERDGFLYWGRDSGGGSPGEIGYAPVDDLTQYQPLAAVQTGVFYSTQTQNGLLFFGGSVEGGPYETDARVRVWVVDHDNQVSEVFAVAKSGYASKKAYATIANMATSPVEEGVAFGTTYTDPTQAKGVESY
jgi:hypothetical protein